jgi:hypothetical protein
VLAAAVTVGAVVVVAIDVDAVLIGGMGLPADDDVAAAAP